MSKHKKNHKTNVMRILEDHEIAYEPIFYECDQFIDGIHSAQASGRAFESSFKTLIAQGKSGDYYVYVLPVKEEVDLKKAAQVVNEKAITLLPVKDITKVTGYVRGGCSPLGLKKEMVTVIEETAQLFDQIYISAGKIGASVGVNPDALRSLLQASYADFCIEA